ncbi:MAG: L,D-transpeptidase family protein [Gemmatimonadota bacterium]|nr:L,D-transpeptidase family protein [Gemmatimonadota bacterium]
MRWVTGLAGLMLAVGGAAPSAAQPAPASVERELEWLIERLQVSGSLTIAGATVRASDVTLQVYERQAFAPLWSRKGDLAALLRTVYTVYTDGLDPDLYHRAVLSSLWAAELDPPRAAELDLLATDALLRLSQDLSFGRAQPIDPTGLVNGDGPFGGGDPVASLREVLASGGLEQRVAALRPSHFEYDRLRDGLSELRALQRAGGWTPIPGGPTMQRGSPDLRIPLLRQRLAVSGDLPGEGQQLGEGLDETHFDTALEDAVKTFQHRHGLNEDGRVGNRTLAALNVPVERRIEQIRVNLERARWVADAVPDTYVAVNVAGARVYLIRSETVAFEARAVVGSDETQTPVFSALLSYIDLNPTWTVPGGIVEEVLEAVRRDPLYLENQRMHVLDAEGRRVDASTLDFRTFTPETFPYVFYQEPGPRNPLGRLKLMFPNPYTVYLHDSPARSLFALERRLFSHGCVRVEDPVGLAVEVLDEPATWSREALEAAIAEGETRTIPLKRPLMVHVVYRTAEADADGALHFYADVYQRDPGVLAALDAR